MVTECEIPPVQFLHEKPDKALKGAGVYSIFCDVNGKYYVGSSARMGLRFCQHRDAFLRGDHCNPNMRRAYKKYGSHRFLFKALEFTEKSPEALIACERKWIAALDAVESGFNIMPAANSPLGVLRENKDKFKAAALARSKDPNSRTNRKYKFLSPDGRLFEGFNVAQFCREQGFTIGMKTNLQKLARGDIGSYSGWTSPGIKPFGKRRGWPSAFSFTDKNGVIHTGDNVSEFCRSIGVHIGFFAALIKGMRNQLGWTITPGFVFKKQKQQPEDFCLISPDGEEKRFSSVKVFAAENGLNPRCFRMFLSSNAVQYKGWRKSPCS